MDVQHHRILPAGLVIVRLHQPRLDLEIADAAIREPLRVAPRHFGIQRVVEVRDLLLARTAAVRHEQLGGLGHRCRDVGHHRASFVHRRVRGATTTTDEFLRCTTVDVGIENRGTTTDGCCKTDRTIRHPGDALRLVLPAAEQVFRCAAGGVDDVDTRRLRTRRTTDERDPPAVSRPLQIRLGAHPLRHFPRRATADGHDVDVTLVAFRFVTRAVVRQPAERVALDIDDAVGAQLRVGDEGDPLPVGRHHGAAMRVGRAGELHLGRVAVGLLPELRRAPGARRATAGDEAGGVRLEVHVGEVPSIETRRIGGHRDRLERRTRQRRHAHERVAERRRVGGHRFGPHRELPIPRHAARGGHRRHLHRFTTGAVDADHPDVALALRTGGGEQQVVAIG